MLKKITMPPGGQTTDELIIAKWHKQVGDKVNRGDVLLEVETDKATLEVESFAKGSLLKIMVNEGDKAYVGDVIAYVGNESDLTELEESATDKSVAPQVPEEDEYQPIMPEMPVETELETEKSDRPIASPAAKKAVRDLGYDLSDVYEKTGKPILKKNDVFAYSPEKVETTSEISDYEIIPISGMRKTIASRMVESVTTIPAFGAEIEVDMSACMTFRSEMNNYTKDVKIAYHDILAKCFAVAAKDYPLVNASYGTDGIKVYKSVNAGIAVSLENGLVVPVTMAVDKKNLAEIAKESKESISKVREGHIDPANLEAGTMTISNLGMYPVSRFTAIINPPQTCILALGAIVKRPTWKEGQWVEKPIMTITASFDHRVVDGAYGAAFLGKLKKLMEYPALMLV